MNTAGRDLFEELDRIAAETKAAIAPKCEVIDFAAASHTIRRRRAIRTLQEVARAHDGGDAA